MKKYLVLIALFVMQISSGQQTTTTYYFIRHAEKVDNSKNPDLSEKGLERAKLWQTILSDVKLDQIYSTDYKRTIQTVNVIASAKGIPITIYNPKMIDRTTFVNENLGKKVLVVGHSNTTPAFVNQIINEKMYTDIDDNTFGNLYIVTIIGNVITHQLLKLP